VAIGQLYVELPYMILPIYASLERLDPSLLDAASDLGATPMTTLRRIVIPLAAPGIIAGCVLVFVPSLGSVLVPDLLGGAKTAWVGTLITSQFGAARDPALGSAMAFALSLITLGAFLAFGRFLRKGPGLSGA
jgi:spermidine/putrescine transport system permease protein